MAEPAQQNHQIFDEQQPTNAQVQSTTTGPKPEGVRTRVSLGTHSTSSTPLPSVTFEDQENGNLSWLLDFKLDSFIDAPDDRSTAYSRDFQG